MEGVEGVGDSRQIAIFSGYAAQMQPQSWEVANKRTYVPYAREKLVAKYSP